MIFYDNASLFVSSHYLYLHTIIIGLLLFLGGYVFHLKQISPEIDIVVNYLGIPDIHTNRK